MNSLSLRAALLAVAGLTLCHCGDDSTGNGPSDGGKDSGPTVDGGVDAGCASGCNGTRDYDAQSYTLRGKFDWNVRRLIAEEDITIKLTKAGQSVVALDAAVEVKRVSAGGTDLRWAYDTTQKVLHVDLSSLRGDAATFTVNYETGVSNALVASKGRDGDPVTSRVVFTNSEPDRARNWLVSNDHPSDRALWSVEITAAGDEDVIANGERVRDDVKDGARIVGYKITTPLPTYLMAFAAGQLEHRDRAGWRVPLSVWYRRGLVLDAQAHLDVLVELMGTFDKLVDPYPFSRYSVVLLPEFGGGMENATITFNQESSGQGNVSFGLNAHELAHHWFGDWVTMRDYDAMWFKEGMATLLAAEAERKYREGDGPAKGQRLFGNDFGFSATDAVVDKSLRSLAKYTSGPYERAAWTITKIRARVGEDAFWKSLRELLKSRPAGTIDSEGFVRAFAPALDEPSIAKLLATLEKKEPPAVAIEAPLDADAGAAAQVKLTLTDPSAALLDPIDVAVVDQEGTAAPAQKLAPGAPLTITVPPGGYLVYDEREVNPNWDESFDVDPDAYSTRLVPLMVPTTPGARNTFGTHSAGVQERVLFNLLGAPAPFGPGELGAFYASLDSRYAKYATTQAACQWLDRVVKDGGNPAEWAAAIEPIAKQPAVPSYNTRFALCGAAFPLQWFGAELTTPVTAANAVRKNLLLGFDYGPEKSFDYAARLATQAPSLALRDQAISRLASQAAAERYTRVPAEAVPAWKEFFRARLAETTAQSRFRNVWKALVALSDDTALAAVGLKLRAIPMGAALQRQVVCEANRVAQARPEAWEEFRTSAKPWETLAPDALAVIQDPTKCAAPLAPAARGRVRTPVDSTALQAREAR